MLPTEVVEQSRIMPQECTAEKDPNQIELGQSRIGEDLMLSHGVEKRDEWIVRSLMTSKLTDARIKPPKAVVIDVKVPIRQKIFTESNNTSNPFKHKIGEVNSRQEGS